VDGKEVRCRRIVRPDPGDVELGSSGGGGIGAEEVLGSCGVAVTGASGLRVADFNGIGVSVVDRDDLVDPCGFFSSIGVSNGCDVMLLSGVEVEGVM
jgi:hypothetical protein